MICWSRDLYDDLLHLWFIWCRVEFVRWFVGVVIQMMMCWIVTSSNSNKSDSNHDEDLLNVWGHVMMSTTPLKLTHSTTPLFFSHYMASHIHATHSRHFRGLECVRPCNDWKTEELLNVWVWEELLNVWWFVGVVIQMMMCWIGVWEDLLNVWFGWLILWDDMFKSWFRWLIWITNATCWRRHSNLTCWNSTCWSRDSDESSQSQQDESSESQLHDLLNAGVKKSTSHSNHQFNKTFPSPTQHIISHHHQLNTSSSAARFQQVISRIQQVIWIRSRQWTKKIWFTVWERYSIAHADAENLTNSTSIWIPRTQQFLKSRWQDSRIFCALYISSHCQWKAQHCARQRREFHELNEYLNSLPNESCKSYEIMSRPDHTNSADPQIWRQDSRRWRAEYDVSHCRWDWPRRQGQHCFRWR